MERYIDIESLDYELTDERIAKFPLSRREASKLLVYRQGEILERKFSDIASALPSNQLLVFNNTKVIRARLMMYKASGTRVEVFCLEPHSPADYERAFSVKGSAEWSAVVGNLKKWKEGSVDINFEWGEGEHSLRCYMVERGEREHIVRFEWSADLTFGQLLEHLGTIPIPPYLNRESTSTDDTRYQTVYSKFEGSVAAPTAGLHFTDSLLDELREAGVKTEELTLHVGAGTFLPVKEQNATEHKMHTEHFEITQQSVERLHSYIGRITAVGTTSVRTLESLVALAWRIKLTGEPDLQRPIGQWELYDIDEEFSGEVALQVLLKWMQSVEAESIKASTRIMITPLGFRFRVVRNIITNFHQPRSTLLLLVSAFVGEAWRDIYDYALENDFRFLSYGDSSLLLGE